jgi:hypothetical protein
MAKATRLVPEDTTMATEMGVVGEEAVAMVVGEEAMVRVEEDMAEEGDEDGGKSLSPPGWKYHLQQVGQEHSNREKIVLGNCLETCPFERQEDTSRSDETIAPRPAKLCLHGPVHAEWRPGEYFDSFPLQLLQAMAPQLAKDQAKWNLLCCYWEQLRSMPQVAMERTDSTGRSGPGVESFRSLGSLGLSEGLAPSAK